MLNLRKVIILFLTVTLILLSACHSAGSPEEIVEFFMDAVKKQDTEAALACVYPPARKQCRITLQKSAEILRQDEELLLGGIIGYTDTEASRYRVLSITETDDTHADVTVSILNGSEEIQTIRIPCIRHTGSWYLMY